MALGDVIARLAVSLSLETAAFEKGADVAEKRLAQTQRSLSKIGDKMTGIGKSMSLAITAPVVGAGAAVIKMSGDFEAAMNRVSISTQGSVAEMKAMNDLALELGKSTVFGATEAADAMDMLAKNGLNARQILDGAATAAVNLASAAGSELSPAANAITDVMQQFKVATQDLPMVVNQITGAVNESKLDFEDFALAIGQAGGVAGGVGVGFEDFNAVLAGTSSLFASGSDAGTSFKTFLTTLPGKSSTARAAIQELGLQFYNADGSLRSMSEIAQELQDKLSGLSDVAKQEALTQIFGTDAMRTAVGLMDLGAKGLDDIKARIQETDAAAQSAQRLKGFNGQLEELKGAVETLAIRIGQSGVLEAITGLVVRLANFIDTLSELNPNILKFVAVMAAVAAGVGPVLIGLGAIVNSVSVLLPVLIKLAPALGLVGKALLFIAANPVILALAGVIAGIYLAWQNWDKIAPVLQRLWSAVKQYIGEGLTRVLQAVLNPIAAVKRAFFDLYDAVVGHSYIPDMVDGIAAQMQRLDAVMVQPVTKATTKAQEAFRDMALETQMLLDRLFPEVRKLLDYRADLGRIERSGLSAEQQREARRRLGIEFGGGGGLGDPDFSEVEPLTGGLKNVEDAIERLTEKAKVGTVRIAKSFKDMAEETLNSLSRLTSAIKGGGFLGIREAVVGFGLQLGSIGVFGKGVAARLNSTPGYALGTMSARRGLAWVGERGPELVNFRGGERVYNNRDSRAMMGGQLEIRPSPLFEVYLDGKLVQAAPSIADAGARGGVARMSYLGSRRL
jgi:TP901 family phage tail tape measure protein